MIVVVVPRPHQPRRIALRELEWSDLPEVLVFDRSHHPGGPPMIFAFDDCEIDPDRRELRRGGKAVHVEPQVFDVLIHLLRHRDRVVSKDELMQTVWGGRIVSEATLTSRIGAARRAIGDTGKQQARLRTIARRGFRFVGEVRQEASRRKEFEAADHVGATAGPDPANTVPPQEIKFVRTSDDVHLAVATVGDGPTLVKATNWLNHLEYDWRSPVWSPTLTRLAANYRLVRYDGRGLGLSDWDVADLSFEAYVRDLETVVDTLGLERFRYWVSQAALRSRSPMRHATPTAYRASFSLPDFRMVGSSAAARQRSPSARRSSP